MNALRSAGYLKIALVVDEQQRTVSQTQLAAMRAKIMAHWSPNDAIFGRPDQHVVLVRVQLGPDRMLSAPPQVVSTGSGPLKLLRRRPNAPFCFRSRSTCFRCPPTTYGRTWRSTSISVLPRPEPGPPGRWRPGGCLASAMETGSPAPKARTSWRESFPRGPSVNSLIPRNSRWAVERKRSNDLR